MSSGIDSTLENLTEPMSTVQNWTPFRSEFPGFVLSTAFAVVKGGTIDKAGAATLAHCGVELELWALGCYFGSTPMVGSAPDTLDDLTDDEAHALLANCQTEHEHEGFSSEGPDAATAMMFPLPPAIALNLAFGLLKLAARVLL